jgi:small subunit ribosomal protein S12
MPQIKGVILKLFTLKPKKPNSGLRKVCLLRTKSKNILSYIPGFNSKLNVYNIVLVRHGKTKDLPGLKYRVIRGKYDSNCVIRKSSRSLYGCKK